MSNKITRIVFILLLATPSLVLAQGGDAWNNIVSSLTFTPAITDLSVSYLGQIFGTVGTVLHGTSGQLLGQLFKIFNLGLLVVAGLFLIYTIIMTILNTAHEGEFMGRKWNSAWIVLRVILGLGLLVPSATTGYSLIQVGVMWVVIQGAGFANMAWQSALLYLTEGGQVYTPPQTDTSSMINAAGTILESQVCMYTNQNIWLQHQKSQQQAEAQQQAQSGQTGNTTNTATPQVPETSYVQKWVPLFIIVEDGTTFRSVVKFPGNPYTESGQQDNACGQIAFGANPDKGGLTRSQKVSTLKAAVNQMILDLDSMAQSIASQVIPSSQSAGGGADQASANFPNQVQTALVSAAADWVNTTLPIRSGSTVEQASQDAIEAYVKNAAAQGWIMAGEYYFSLGSIQQKITAATSVTVNADFYPGGFPGSWSPDTAKVNQDQSYIDFSADQASPVPSTTSMKGLPLLSVDEQNNLLKAEVNAASLIHPAISLANQVDKQNAGLSGASDSSNVGALSFMFSPMTSTITQLYKSMYSATGDPIVVIEDMGHRLLGAAIAMWLVGTVGSLGLGAISSIWSMWSPMGYAATDALLAFIPIFTAFTLSLAVQGSIFAFYIPLIPYIIFTFAGIGWLIAVMEAMVAAPLVALGVTHPEGHDFLGKSEQAIMLVLSIFLRPVLMIIGLIAGMILSRVALRFLNAGFFNALQLILGESWTVFAFVPLMFVYASLLITVVNQSFSLIHAIPERVMRWLGTPEQPAGGIQEALQSSRQGYEQVSGATDKLGGGAMQGQGEAVSKAAARYREAGGADRDVSGRGDS